MLKSDNCKRENKIVEKVSLTAARREADLSSTTVSERLAALQTLFGVVLLNRTTWAISLTEEGPTLDEGAKRVLGEVEDLEARIRHAAQTLSGPIRLNVPIDIGRAAVSDEINRFVARHPKISNELMLSDGHEDVVYEGVEIALRFGRVNDTHSESGILGGPSDSFVVSALTLPVWP